MKSAHHSMAGSLHFLYSYRIARQLALLLVGEFSDVGVTFPPLGLSRHFSYKGNITQMPISSSPSFAEVSQPLAAAGIRGNRGDAKSRKAKGTFRGGIQDSA